MFEKVQEFIAEQLSCEISEIQLETSFSEDLGVDSLDLFEIVMAIEEEFKVKIPSDQLEAMHTVNDVIDFLSVNQ